MVPRMIDVMLVSESWSKVVQVESADDLIEAEGMTWEREGLGSDGDADVPRYVPAVSG